MNIKVTLPNGSVRTYKSPITVYNIAKDISESLARNTISAKFNDKIVETSTSLSDNGKLILYTWNDENGKKAFWHSSSHIMAQALEDLYPGIKLTIGPAIEKGFYYDVDLKNQVISEKDFPKIEAKMIEIAKGKHTFELKNIKKADAIDKYKNENNPYKLELIKDLKDGEITFCHHSDFSDLCKGGHIPNTGIVKAVKLLSVAGAYW